MITTETNTTQNGEDNMETAPLGKNPTWERNHVTITDAIDQLVRRNERWPTKTEIAEESGFTRATIYRHLEQFGQEDYAIEEMNELKFMSSKLQAKMCEKAMDGDVKCMRLAFEVMGVLKRGRNGVGLNDTKQKSH